jgi:hypothetical protein
MFIIDGFGEKMVCPHLLIITIISIISSASSSSPPHPPPSPNRPHLQQTNIAFIKPIGILV